MGRKLSHQPIQQMGNNDHPPEEGKNNKSDETDS
jgi:hypothetical protein